VLILETSNIQTFDSQRIRNSAKRLDSAEFKPPASPMDTTDSKI